MSEYHVKILKTLDKVLFDDVGETPAEVRQRLEEEGVDVTGLVARIKAAAGTAYREVLVEEAKKTVYISITMTAQSHYSGGTMMKMTEELGIHSR